MIRIGIVYNDVKYARTLHESKLFVLPVGEQETHTWYGVWIGRTESSKANRYITKFR